MILNKYVTGALTLAITLLTAFVAIPESAWADGTTIWQFIALAVSSITAIILPLSEGIWAGFLKTGSAIVLAVIGALIPLLANGTLTTTQIILLVLAGLNALAIELGVKVRIDSAKDQVVNPEVSTVVIRTVDPKATAIATQQVVDAQRHAGV